MPDSKRRRIPEATVARLPVYLRILLELAQEKLVTISSERLAELAGVNAAKVRKDLSYLGSYGTRGVGYDVEYLMFQMSRALGLTQDWPVIIVGIGNLGSALANYGGFTERGFPVAALVDADPRKVGQRVGGLTIRHIDELPAIVADSGNAIGIIATPAAAAQDVADRMVEAGIGSVLNFAPAVITVPGDASLRKVDLAVELQILSFYQQHKANTAKKGTAKAAKAAKGAKKAAKKAANSVAKEAAKESTDVRAGKGAGAVKASKGAAGAKRGAGSTGKGGGEGKGASAGKRGGRGGGQGNGGGGGAGGGKSVANGERPARRTGRVNRPPGAKGSPDVSLPVAESETVPAP